MDAELRRAWTETVTADDYDQHMAAIGQAEANANIVVEMLERLDAKSFPRLLIAGAGTGQMFDFVSPDILSHRLVTFTDINPHYLEKLTTRLNGSCIQFQTVVDDIEQTALKSEFDAVILVLVLEHVEWQRALAEVARLQPRALVTITQENPPEIESAVTPGRAIPESLRIASQTAHPHLLDHAEFENVLSDQGFTLHERIDRRVDDDKLMRGALFEARQDFFDSSRPSEPPPSKRSSFEGGVGSIGAKLGFWLRIPTRGSTKPLPSAGEVGELACPELVEGANREGGTTVKPAKHDFFLVLTALGGWGREILSARPMEQYTC